MTTAADILTAAGIEHAGMSDTTRAQLAKFITNRNAKRAKSQASTLTELEHPTAPGPKKRGTRWRLALAHADGRRIELGVGEFATQLAAHKHVHEFTRGKSSLEKFCPVIEEVAP
jgi:hypothetical protein